MAGTVEEDVEADDGVFDGVLDHCTGMGGAAAAAAFAFSTASLAAAGCVLTLRPLKSAEKSLSSSAVGVSKNCAASGDNADAMK